jgi:hypothetical protein
MAWEPRVNLMGPPGSDADVDEHVAEPDPHPQYTTAAELSTVLGGYQPLDTDLTTIAGLTATTDSFLQAKSSAWTTRTPAQVKTDLALAKGDVGLGNVDNTADTAKPVSTAQQSALDLKAPLASPAFTGTPTGITKAHVGLGNVDNTADSAKPVSSAQQTALDGKQPLDSDLTTIAGLTATTDSFLQAKSSAWTTRTPAQVKTDLAIVAGDITSGTFGIGRIPTGTTSSTVAIGNDTRLSVKPYPPVTLTDQATVTTDASLGTHFRLTGSTSGRTIAAPTNPTDGQVITYEIKNSSGSITLTHTWNAVFAYGSDVTALTAIAIGKTDFIQWVYCSSVSKWQLIGYMKGFTT